MKLWFIKRKIHISWLISIVCFAFLVGVFLAQYVKTSQNLSFIYLVISLLLISISLWKKTIYLISVLIIGGVLFGLWRGALMQSELNQFESFYSKNVVISGTVKDDVDINASNQLAIRLGNLNIGGDKIPGSVYVTANGSEIKRGDILVLSGKLKEGFGNFSGIIYRAKIEKIIHPHPGDIARVIRDWFADAVRLAIPDPEASLGIGFLVGQRRSLSADLVLALQISGLTHVVVASGYNLTILVRLARRLFVKVSKYLSALSASIMVFVFIAITGLSPSMSRAGLVAFLSLGAWYYGRKFHPIVLLSIAIAVTLILNPSYAWGDLGWQLSFAAFAGVMIIAPLGQRYLFGDKQPGAIRQILGETISAQIATAPILIFSFGQFSNVAILSNLLILPFVPIAMLLTFISGLGSVLFPAWALIIGTPANWLLGYMVGVAGYLASLPWAMSVIKMPWWGVWVCYLLITFGCIYLCRVTKYNLRDVNLVE